MGLTIQHIASSLFKEFFCIVLPSDVFGNALIRVLLLTDLMKMWAGWRQWTKLELKYYTPML